MKKISTAHRAVIDRIQKSIPKYLTDSVITKTTASPELAEALKRGVSDDYFSEEARHKWQLILDSGILEREIEQEVPEIAEELNAYVELEMAKAVIRKELPKPKKKIMAYERLLKNYNLIKQTNDKKFNRN